MIFGFIAAEKAEFSAGCLRDSRSVESKRHVGPREMMYLMSASPPFSLARAVREWAFVEPPLITLKSFRDLLKSRGLSDFGLFSTRPWEELDRAGIIEPVAYARHHQWGYDLQGCLADGDLKIREEVGFVAWEALAADAADVYGNEADLQVLYHRWQIFAVAEFQDLVRARTPWHALEGGLDAFAEARNSYQTLTSIPSLNDLQAHARRWQARELLLIRVQNMLWPFEAGGPGQVKYAGHSVPGLADNSADWARQQHAIADYADIARDCSVTMSDLREASRDLLLRARNLDPNEHLFELLDLVRRSKRERHTGPARLAVDYYDAARMLARWHNLCGSDEHDRLSMDLDDIQGPIRRQYKNDRYGTADVRGNLEALPLLLESYGLYPWRVHLIAEGECEIVALRIILSEGYGLSPERLGITATHIDGADIPKNAELLLAAFRPYSNYFLLVFDNEGRAAELIEALDRAGVVQGVPEKRRAEIRQQLTEAAKKISDPDAQTAAFKAARDQVAGLHHEPGAAGEFILWKENFEADNFTSTELCKVTTRLMRAATDVGAPAITVDDLAREQTSHPKRGIASLLVGLAEQRLAPVSKPDLARELARHALDHPTLNEKPRPVLSLAQHLVMMCRADREFSRAAQQRTADL